MMNKENKALLRKISKPLGWLLCAYLTLFFAVLIPFHHHANDKAADNDCQICAVAGQAVIANAGPSAIVFFIFFLIVVSGSSAVISSRSKIPHLRGPPIF